MERLGIVDDIRAERAAILANVAPRHRARILGKPAPYAEPKRHEITVNLKTGERTVKAAPVFAVAKPPRVQSVRPVVYDHPPAPPVCKPAEKAIMAAILEATGISLYEYLREHRTNIKVTRARQMGYWMTKKLRPEMSLHELGRMFRKDHSTVLKGIGRGEALKDFAPICDWLAHPAIVSLMEEGRRP